MKLFIIALTLLSSLTAAAICEKDIKAKNVIKVLAPLSDNRFFEKLYSAENHIKTNGFCSGINNQLTAIGFCIDVFLEVSQSVMINNNPMTVVKRYDTPEVAVALKEFGRLFISSEEDSNTFNCELKRLKFSSVNN